MEPVDVQTARERLGIVSTHRDAEIERLITAARLRVEALSQTILVPRTITEPVYLDYGVTRAAKISAWPITDVVKVSYVDADFNPVDFTDFNVVSQRRPSWIVPVTAWPSDMQAPVAQIEAGRTDFEIPETLIQAILVLVGLWFDDHEGNHNVPPAVLDLCSAHARLLI